MTKRLEKIFSDIPVCEVFADIGCDHGYISKRMLDSGKCKKVILSDVSEKCLKKAEKLLSTYIKDGFATAVVSDGFDNISYCDVALIAGMGGEEIINILKKSKFLPKKLVLQPMKNCDKVRKALISLGYKIEKDFVFFAEEKFYDLIVCTVGKDELSADEIEFGRTNLIQKNEAFYDRIKTNICAIEMRIQNPDMPKNLVEEGEKEIERLKRYVENG